MKMNSETLIREFRDPSGDYVPLLMWFWSDVVTKEQITFQMEKMREQNIQNFFVHPSGGICTEYLSDEYKELIRFVVSEAKRLGMHYWIYDEYDWPSGIAGGELCRRYPQYRKKQLQVFDQNLHIAGELVKLACRGQLVGAQLVTEKNGLTFARDITGECKLEHHGEYTELTYKYDECNIPGRALFFFSAVDLDVRPSGDAREGAERVGGYVDMLSREAVGKFIELTHEWYKDAVGDEFGKTVRGVFTDEPTPNIMYYYTAAGIWNDDFPAEFEKDHGYSILPWLYTLWGFEAKRPEEIRAQSDYRATVKRLYFDAFMSQIHDWCKANGLIYTGHFGGEENMMNNLAQGDMLEELMLFDMPGADSILSTERIDTPEFDIAGKLASTAAKFIGSDRVLCETFTGSGWRVRFPMMRRIANRLLVLGVNWIQYMGAFYNMGGAAKNFPGGWAPSHNYNNTMFRHYHDLNKYIAGFQALSAKTRPDSNVLLFLPLQQTIHDRHHWINGKWNEFDAFDSFFERSFISTMNALIYEGVALDLFSENLTDAITVHDGYVEAYGYRYDTLVFPRMHYVNSKTRALIENLKNHDVKMVFTYAMPGVDTGTGLPFDPGFQMEVSNTSCCLQRDDNAWFIAMDDPDKLDVYRSAVREVIGKRSLNIVADNGVYIGQRSNEETELWFLCNDKLEEATAIIDALPGMQIIGADTEQAPVYTVEDGRIRVTLRGYEMLAILRDKNGTELPVSTPAALPAKANMVLEAPYAFTAEEGNFLPVNYEMYDPDTGLWDPCRYMYYSDKIHLRTGEQYKLRARVQIDAVPEKLLLNTEIRRVSRIAVNGTELELCVNCKRFTPADYTGEITALVHEGENIIELEGTMQNFAKFSRPPYLYLSGSFLLDADDHITAAAAEIPAIGWEKAGYPYYCGDGIYKIAVTVDGRWEKAVLTVPTEDVAMVWVNGEYVGKKLWLYREMDVTGFLKPGENTVEIRTTSTRANMFRCDAEGFDESIFYAHFAAEQTENGLIAPLELHFYG